MVARLGRRSDAVPSSENRGRINVAPIVGTECDGLPYAVAEVSRWPQPWSRMPRAIKRTPKTIA
jgi:hypothetical protein